jgi:hypothetical protein
MQNRLQQFVCGCGRKLAGNNGCAKKLRACSLWSLTGAESKRLRRLAETRQAEDAGRVSRAIFCLP